MKIAFINSVAGFGSTGRLVYYLSKTEGVTSRIYYGRKKNMTDADVFRMTSFPGNVSHALATYTRDAHGFANAKETERMLEDLRKFAPDLVHLHNLHGYYLNVEVLFRGLKELGVPVIWTLHDCWTFTGHCAHYDSVGCDKWKTGCTACKCLNRYPVTWNGRHVEENYARKKEIFNSLEDLTIVTPSAWLKDQVQQSFLSGIDTRVIHNGIDLKVFRPVKSDMDKLYRLEDKYVIMAVASVWTHEKGLHDLVQFNRKLREDEVLVIVGINEKQKEMFTPQTRLITRTNDQEELAKLYTAADVLIDPTLEDTFPTVCLEAQACGTPVVTYATGGAPETISEKTGIVVPKEGLSVMREAIDRLRETPLKREDCVERAQAFTYEGMLGKYAALYREKTGR